MKVFIVLSIVAACAFAKPSTVFTGVPLTYAAAPVAYAGAPVAYAAGPVQYAAGPVAYAAGPVAVSSQFHAQDELGQYNYGYSSGLSSKVESKSLDGVTRGGYSYIDAEGKVQNVQYTADPVHGFRVAATNLPVGPVAAKAIEVELPKPVVDTPEVAAAKIQHMAAVNEAKVRNAAVSEVEVVAPVVAPVVPQVVSPITHIAPAVAAVKYAAPSSFSYGYTAQAPYAAYHSNLIGSPVAYSGSPLAYSAPVAYAAYPHGYAYNVPSFYNYNFVPKVEEVKEVIKA